ncbi:MAG: DUF4869 domain-containing protein [Clostridium sp.]|nr:DUF4869 domain-containing protein [Clostridium sp.]MCM1170634.1 DUF4869 domain-containing protein [Clostridium sp.]MCM1209319.1 DUF4869 domain-containing protein [Ruminococcus sp.]
MITIYKSKTDIPKGVELVELNDLFFNQNIIERFDMRAENIIRKIDGAALREDYKITSGVNGELLNIDKLSTGCKTALNIYYFPERVFSLKECGNNALDVIYAYQDGQVYSEYPIITLFMSCVQVCGQDEKRVISNYEELKGWWNHV